MTESETFSVYIFVIVDTHATVVALWDMSAVVAYYSTIVSFFVSDDEDAFILFEVFVDTLLGELWKMVIQFFGHIDKKNVFCLPVYCRGELFVVHTFEDRETGWYCKKK